MAEYDEPACNCIGCQIKLLGDQVHHRINGNAQKEDELLNIIGRINEISSLDMRKTAMTVERSVPPIRGY